MSTKRGFYNLCLLASVLLIRELWDLYRDQHYTVNPWITLNYPYSVQWFVKDLGRDIGDIIMAIIIFRGTRMQSAFRIGAIVFLFFMCLELVLFIFNFNQNSYLLVYLSLFLVTLTVTYFHYYAANHALCRQMKLFIRWYNKELSKMSNFVKNIYVKVSKH